MATNYDLKWDGFAGTKLTNGSYLEMHQNYAKLLAKTRAEGQDPLKVGTLLTEYMTLVDDMAQFINQSQAYAQTPAIKRADLVRDLCNQAFEHYIDYLLKLPEDHALYPHVKAIAMAKAPYKNMEKHEMTKQTMETAGMVRDLTQSATMLKHLKAVGMDIVITTMEEANNTIRAEFEKRQQERGERKEAKQGETTETLRVKINGVFDKLLSRVNAVANLTDEADEGYEDVRRYIVSANGVADHYRQVLAQKSRKPKSDDKKDDKGDDDQGGDEDKKEEASDPGREQE